MHAFVYVCVHVRMVGERYAYVGVRAGYTENKERAAKLGRACIYTIPTSLPIWSTYRGTCSCVMLLRASLHHISLPASSVYNARARTLIIIIIIIIISMIS